VFDRFKTRENTFFDKLEDDLFMSLYEMKEYAHKTYLLAMKWGIGTIKMELWRSHANFIQRIIDNVAYRSHGWAVRELKAHFGGEEDLSKSENKAAKRIIREASRPHHSMAMPPQNQGMPWGPPQFVPPPPYDDGNEYAPSVFPSTADYAGPSKASWGIWWRLLQVWSTWAYGSCLSWNDENDDPSKQWRRKKTLQAIQEGKERITFLFALFSEQWHDYFVKNIYVL